LLKWLSPEVVIPNKRQLTTITFILRLMGLANDMPQLLVRIAELSAMPTY
jgi:hypothetical protein